MINKIVYLNYALLNLPDDFKKEFINNINNSVIDKYQGTGVVVVDNLDDLTEILYANPEAQMVSVAVHNTPAIDCYSPENVLGNAYKGCNMAFVPLDEFTTSDPLALANQIGTVASHESGHIFLPDDHSIDKLNIMNDGPTLMEELQKDNGESLEFTEFQKYILMDKIPVEGFSTLAQAEQTYLNISVDNDIDNQEMGSDNDEISETNEDVQIEDGQSPVEYDSDIGDIDSDF